MNTPRAKTSFPQYCPRVEEVSAILRLSPGTFITLIMGDGYGLTLQCSNMRIGENYITENDTGPLTWLVRNEEHHQQMLAFMLPVYILADIQANKLVSSCSQRMSSSTPSSLSVLDLEKFPFSSTSSSGPKTFKNATSQLYLHKRKEGYSKSIRVTRSLYKLEFLIYHCTTASEYPKTQPWVIFTQKTG